MSCICQSCYKPCQSCSCTTQCVTTGCPIQLDSSCVFYHKNNSELSELENLGIQNGATLEYILEVIDATLGDSGIDILNFSLPCLRDRYTVNTLQQFAQAVDTDLCLILDKLDFLENRIYLGVFTLADPVVDNTQEGVIWWRSDLSELRGYFDGAVYIITTTPA